MTDVRKPLFRVHESAATQRCQGFTNVVYCGRVE
jgi:hypothetical protein